jgi:hypothetical protein
VLSSKIFFLKDFYGEETQLWSAGACSRFQSGGKSLLQGGKHQSQLGTVAPLFKPHAIPNPYKNFVLLQTSCFFRKIFQKLDAQAADLESLSHF